MSDTDLIDKRQQRHRTRDRILAAAREIVMRDGYSELTMRRLAAAVGYSPAALYLHFAGRDEIALILRDEALAALALALDEHALEVADVHPIQAVGRAWLNFARTQPQLYALALIERMPLVIGAIEAVEAAGVADASDANDDSVPAVPGEALPAGAAVQRSLLRALRPEDPSTPMYGLDARAETVMAVLHGLASLQLLQPGMLTVPVDALLQLALRSLLRGWPGMPERAA